MKCANHPNLVIMSKWKSMTGSVFTQPVFIDDTYAPPNVDSQVYSHFCVTASEFLL